ncbi:MAG: MFS transporter [Nannocystaceae bacterium]|nr:MFS transporter [Nannocystaceae bacterium]
MGSAAPEHGEGERGRGHAAAAQPQRWALWARLGGFYLVQGIVYGYGGFLLLPRLAAAEVGLWVQAAIVSLASVPWVFKLAWGPWIDAPWARRVGPARIAASATAVLAGLLALLVLVRDPASQLLLVASLWLAINVAQSLQDVATDALAFDRVAPVDRGRAWSIMLGAHHIGDGLVIAAVIAPVAARAGLTGATATTAAIVAAIAIAAGLPWRRTAAAGPRGARPDLRQAGLALRGSVRAVIFATVVFAADVLTAAISTEWLTQGLRWSPEAVAERLAWLLAPATLAGYASAAVVLSRWGARRVGAIACVLLGLAWLGFAAAVPLWRTPAFVQGFVVVQAIVTAWVYAASHAVLLDATSPQLRATQFAILTACTNVPRLWAPAVGAAAVAAVGFAGSFALCGAWQIAVALVVLWVRPVPLVGSQR